MSARCLRPGLPPLPPRLAHLPIDERGFPVPWFVLWTDGQPDHRMMDTRKLRLAVTERLCWQCGQPITDASFSFVIGPMCSITRCIAEPPSHLECARYACIACPFLTRPHAHRREAGLPADATVTGNASMRNPGVICIWTTVRADGRPNRPLTAYTIEVERVDVAIGDAIADAMRSAAGPKVGD